MKKAILILALLVAPSYAQRISPQGGTITGATTGGGLTVTNAKLGLKTTCAPTEVLAWDGDSWECNAGGGGGGGFTTAGTGLTSSGTTVNAIGGFGLTANADDLAIDPTETQQRVTGTCAGQVLVGINQDGTVNCEADDNTTYTAGGGLTLGGGAFSVADADRGDVTVSGGGVTWTVDSGAVAVGELANISTARILGRVTAGAGVVEELTGTQATTLLDTFSTSGTTKGLVAGSNGATSSFLRGDNTWQAVVTTDTLGPDGDKGDVTVGGSGTTLTIDGDAVTYAKLQNVAGLSVVGRASNSSGDAADITGTDGQVLRVSGTTLGFGSIPVGSVTGAVDGTGTGGRSARWTDADTLATGAFTDDGTNASLTGLLTVNTTSNGIVTTGNSASIYNTITNTSAAGRSFLVGSTGTGDADPSKFFVYDSTGPGLVLAGNSAGLTVTPPATLTGGLTAPANVTTTGTGSVVSANDVTATDDLFVTDDATVSGGVLTLNNGTSNWVLWSTDGVAAPAFTARSAGTKLVLRPEVDATHADYALGIEGGVLWSSVPDTGGSFKWYGGTTLACTMTALGVLNCVGGLQENGAAVLSGAITDGYVPVGSSENLVNSNVTAGSGIVNVAHVADIAAMGVGDDIALTGATDVGSRIFAFGTDGNVYYDTKLGNNASIIHRVGHNTENGVARVWLTVTGSNGNAAFGAAGSFTGNLSTDASLTAGNAPASDTHILNGNTTINGVAGSPILKVIGATNGQTDGAMQIVSNRTAWGNISAQLATTAGGATTSDNLRISIDSGFIALRPGGGTDAITILHGGNVGIADSSPTNALTVTGAISGSAGVYVDEARAAGFNLNGTTLAFRTGNNDNRLTIDSSGNVTIANGSHALTGTLNANSTAGSNGEVLTIVSGVPQWAAATTYTAGDGLTLTGNDFDLTYTSDFTITSDQLDLSTAVTAPGSFTTAGNATWGDNGSDAHTLNGSLTANSTTPNTSLGSYVRAPRGGGVPVWDTRDSVDYDYDFVATEETVSETTTPQDSTLQIVAANGDTFVVEGLLLFSCSGGDAQFRFTTSAGAITGTGQFQSFTTTGAANFSTDGFNGVTNTATIQAGCAIDGASVLHPVRIAYGFTQGLSAGTIKLQFSPVTNGGGTQTARLERGSYLRIQRVDP